MEQSNKMNYDKFIETYKDTTITYNIDGNNITIPFNSIILFFELNNEKYNNYFITKNSYNEIKLEYFIYSVLSFFKENNIIKNYDLKETIKNRILTLKNDNTIDLEALNTFTETDKTFLAKIKINDSIKNFILKDIPNNLNLLEQAIYVYIKMCKLFKYDAEYYSENQKGISKNKHENIENLLNITPEYNEVICYEFNAIYAKLLSELGINIKLHSASLDGFGGGHASLSFRVDKFLVSADSLTSILKSDLIKAKLNYPLSGLKCINHNENTKKEFYSSITKIYKIVAYQENEKHNNVEKEETFDDILLEYKNVTSNDIYLDINEKLDIMMTKINDSNLNGMDAFSYILMLRKIIFDDIEKEYNIKITIIKNNELETTDKLSYPSAIITINQIDINNFEDNTYYLYNPKKPLSYITLNELIKKFKNGYYEYIDEINNKERIPGILLGKGSK